MSIFLYELRKIFNWRVLVLLLPIIFIFYIMFMEFHFEHFPNGSGVYSYEIQQEMVQTYGNGMDAEDRADFKERHAERMVQADAYIANHPDAQALGVNSYEELWGAESQNEEAWTLRNQLMDEKDGLFWYIQVERSVIEQFEPLAEQYPTTTSTQYERIQEGIATGETESVLPMEVRENYDQLIGYMTMLIVISLIVVLGPVYFRDVTSQVMAIQYTTREGRGIFKRKLWASLVAATLMITALLGSFLLVYVLWNDTTLFWDSHMNSFLNHMFYWPDLTFGAYITVTMGLVYLLGLMATIGIAIVSRFAGSYFSLLGILVPAAILLFVFGIDPLLKQVFSIYRGEYFTQIMYSVLVLIAIVVAIFRTKRERKIDIV